MSSIKETAFTPLKDNQKSEALIVNHPVYLFHVNALVMKTDGKREFVTYKSKSDLSQTDAKDLLPLTNTPLIGRYKNEAWEYLSEIKPITPQYH